MIYAIIPFEEHTVIANKIKEIGVPVCESEAPVVYFVSFGGTTRKLSTLIGFGDDDRVGTGVVLRVENYFGYASEDLWEWMDIHGNGD